MNRSVILKLFCIFLLWRVGLFVISILADFVLPYAPTFPYAETVLPAFGLPRFLYSFANFDGVHYLTIANLGYSQVDYIQAFFPLYPYILLHIPRLVAGSLFNPLVWGLVFSNSAFFLFLCLWFRFVKEEHNEKIAWYSTITYVVFPTSFFFGSLYTESLFMMSIALLLLFVRRKKWIFSSITVALASSTRLVGIFLPLMVLWELYSVYMETTKSRAILPFLRARLREIISILLGLSGFLGYLFFLWQQFGDPLYFFHVQSAFGAGRQTSMVLYPQVVWRYIKIFLTVPLFALKGFAYVQEALAGIIGLLALILSYTRVKMSYFFFAVPAFLLPTLTGNFSSMPRYILVCFPLFLWLGIILSEHKKSAIVFYLVSTLLLLFNTLLFVQGYWVA